MNLSRRNNVGANIRRCLRRHCNLQIGDESRLLSDLRLDSLELIECVFELEQECGKTLNNAELAALLTVEDLLQAFSLSSIVLDDTDDE